MYLATDCVLTPVSYTHLDVYKRQRLQYYEDTFPSFLQIQKKKLKKTKLISKKPSLQLIKVFHLNFLVIICV